MLAELKCGKRFEVSDDSLGNGSDYIFSLSSPVEFSPVFYASSCNKVKSQDLAEGILRLINICVGRQISTVFFLDRSARPASVLFRDAWRILLPVAPLPQTRFINIGLNNEKLQDQNWGDMQKELRTRYTDLDPEGNILVADEYICSGITINRAKSIIKMMYPDANTLATGIFKFMPFWYGHMYTLMSLEENHSDSFNSFFSRKLNLPDSNALLFRQDLSRIARIIAQHTVKSPVGSFKVEPFDPKHRIVIEPKILL